MNWNALSSLEQWQEALAQSHQTPVVVFKHSTRCSVSRMAWKLTEQRWNLPESVPVYYLDLLNHRDVSNAIAQDLNLEHQSPQLILIHAGRSTFHANHSNIDPEALLHYL